MTDMDKEILSFDEMRPVRITDTNMYDWKKYLRRYVICLCDYGKSYYYISMHVYYCLNSASSGVHSHYRSLKKSLFTFAMQCFREYEYDKEKSLEVIFEDEDTFVI